MSRNSFRTLLAVFAVALVAAIPAIASAHNKSHKSHKAIPAVGTIVSYGDTDGTLVVSSGGAPVSAKVTFRTKIKWAPRRGHHYGWFKHHGFGAHASHHGDGGPGKYHTGGGLPSGGGLPTGGGMPTGGGLPTSGGLPSFLTKVLKPGTGVADADLKLTTTGLIWTKLILIRPVATPAT